LTESVHTCVAQVAQEKKGISLFGFETQSSRKFEAVVIKPLVYDVSFVNALERPIEGSNIACKLCGSL